MPRGQLGHHTDAYDSLLDMLAMHADKTITMAAADLARFVRDDGEWNDVRAANTALYISHDEEVA